MLNKLADLIAERIAPWKEVPTLQEIFQSEDPRVVARSLSEFCEAELGLRPAEPLFFFVSVGVVFGLQMPDTQRLVIKVHKPDRSRSFLTQMGKVQKYLAAQGYPCPRPVAAPLPLAHGLATIDELIDEGMFRDGHEPVIRQAIAMALFQHIRLLQNGEQRGIDLTPFDLRLPPDVLWPKPHHAIFNFEATRDGAEWIDALAWKVKQVLEQAELTPVLAHNDFSANQMRFVGNQLRIVYDWDSLTLSSELISVGKTAASFTYTEQPGLSKSGTTEEDTHAFLADYEAVRQKPFTASEQKIIQACILSRKLYGARCWHALHPHEPTFSREWYDTMLDDYKSIF
jgi:Phosphotransferase enzyme family